MATRREKLEVGIVASDAASAVLTDVAAKVEKLDGETAEVRVEADESELDAVFRRLDRLTSQDQVVELKAKATQLEREVQKANRLLLQFDGEKAEAILDARDQATGDIRRVQARIDELDRMSPDVTLEATDNASGEILLATDRARKLDLINPDVTIEATDNSARELNTATDRAETLDRIDPDVHVDATVGTGLSGLFSQVEGIPDAVGGIGTSLAPLIRGGGPIAAMTALFAGSAIKTADIATDVGVVQQLTGDSAEAASGLYAVWRDNVAPEVGDLLDVLAQVNGVLQDQPEIAEQLGVVYDKNKTPLQLFIELVDGLAASQLTAQEKLKLMSELFGEEGARQVAKLIQMTDGDLAGAIENLPEARIMTQEQLDAAEDFRTAMRDVKGEVEALVTSIGNKALPGIAQMAEYMGDIADGDFSGFWDKFWNGADIGELEHFESILDNIDGLNPAETLAQFADHDMGDIAEELGATEQQIKDLISALEDGATPAEAWETVMGEAEVTSKELGDTLRDVADGTGEAAEAQEEYNAQLEEQVEHLEANIELLTDMAEAQMSTADAALELRDADRNLTKALQAYDDAMGDAAATEDDRAEALDNVVQSAKDLADAEVASARAAAGARGETYSNIDALDRQNRSLLQTATTMNGPARDAVLDYVANLNGIPDDVMTEIEAAVAAGDLEEAERLIDEASRTRTAYVNAQANQYALTGVKRELDKLDNPRKVPFTTIFDGSKAAEGLRQLTQPRTVYINATGNRMGATGASYAAGGSYLVGEQGPELVRLPQGAEVLDAGQTNAARGQAGPTTVNYNTINVPLGVNPVDAQRRYVRIQGPQTWDGSPT